MAWISDSGHTIYCDFQILDRIAQGSELVFLCTQGGRLTGFHC